MWAVFKSPGWLMISWGIVPPNMLGMLKTAHGTWSLKHWVTLSLARKMGPLEARWASEACQGGNRVESFLPRLWSKNDQNPMKPLKTAACCILYTRCWGWASTNPSNVCMILQFRQVQVWPRTCQVEIEQKGPDSPQAPGEKKTSQSRGTNDDMMGMWWGNEMIVM